MNAASLSIPPTAEAELQEELKQVLLGLSYRAFEQVLRQLLETMGYTEARLLGRRFLRGRTHHGGRDLEAVAGAGVTRVPVLIQAKQYKRPVSRRFVDELRGAMLRREAHHGLLITTSHFSRRAQEAAQESALAPVYLLDGTRLLQLLVRFRIGVKETAGTLVLDEAYFTRLHTRFPHTPAAAPSAVKQIPSRSECAPGETPEHAGSLDLPEIPDLSLTQGGGMMWRTHFLIGINSLWLLKLLPGALPLPQTATLAGLVAIGALLPDLDAQSAKINSLSLGRIRPLAPLSQLLHRGLGHRGVMHSLLAVGAVAVIGVLLIPLWGWQPGVALTLGYLSHVLADALTRTGVPLLYPSRKRWFLLPRMLRITTGSRAEDLVFFLAALGAALLLLGTLLQMIAQPIPLSPPPAQLVGAIHVSNGPR